MRDHRQLVEGAIHRNRTGVAWRLGDELAWRLPDGHLSTDLVDGSPADVLAEHSRRACSGPPPRC
jgi:hypothetical protein